MNVIPFPPISPQGSNVELISNTEMFRSPLSGAIQTVDRDGETLAINIQYSALKGTNVNRLRGFVASLNGQANRVSLRDHSYEKPSGTLSTVGEMVDVNFNATNWEVSTAGGARGEITDTSDGVRYFGGRNVAGVVLRPTTGADGISAPTEGYSYAARLHVGDARAGLSGGTDTFALRWLDGNWGNPIKDVEQSDVNSGEELVAGATCTDAASFFVRPYARFNSAALTYAMRQDLSRLSVSRCLLVDNGVNFIEESEDFTDAVWAKTRSSFTANASSAPNGQTTADEFIEDSTASQTHYTVNAYTRASIEEFWTGTIFVKENTNQRIRMGVHSINTSADGGIATFDANTGTITQAVSATGGASLAFASIDAYEDGWYRCRVTVKLPATTYVHMIVFMCDGASNTTSYTGDGVSSVYLWGGQLQRGDQMGRYTQTTGTVDAGSNQTGKEIWLKGLNHDEPQQMLAGDQIEINGQLHILDQDLDGDESGCGLAVVTPRVRTAPADETPAIIYRPRGTFILDGRSIAWANRPGGLASAQMRFIQDIAS